MPFTRDSSFCRKVLNHMGKTPKECEGTGVDRQDDNYDDDDDDDDGAMTKYYCPCRSILSTPMYSKNLLVRFKGGRTVG